LSGQVKGEPENSPIKRGDILTIKAAVQRKKGLQAPKNQGRTFMALVNKKTGQVAIDECELKNEIERKEFQHQVREAGTNPFQLIVFDGKGMQDTSFVADFTVE